MAAGTQALNHINTSTHQHINREKDTVWVSFKEETLPQIPQTFPSESHAVNDGRKGSASTLRERSLFLLCLAALLP